MPRTWTWGYGLRAICKKDVPCRFNQHLRQSNRRASTVSYKSAAKDPTCCVKPDFALPTHPSHSGWPSSSTGDYSVQTNIVYLFAQHPTFNREHKTVLLFQVPITSYITASIPCISRLDCQLTRQLPSFSKTRYGRGARNPCKCIPWVCLVAVPNKTQDVAQSIEFPL